MALADTIGVRRIATRDLRHFGAVRLRGGVGLSWWFSRRIRIVPDCRYVWCCMMAGSLGPPRFLRLTTRIQRLYS